jgi:hypothetical protein
LVRALPCHGRGRGFESRLSRHFVAFNQSLIKSLSRHRLFHRIGGLHPRVQIRKVSGLFGALGEPFFDFGRPHDPFWHMRIDRSGTDFDACCNFRGRKLLGVSFANEGLRTTGIVPSLFFVRNMYGNVPDIRSFLAHDALLSPDPLWSFVAAVRGLVHALKSCSPRRDGMTRRMSSRPGAN